jgi:hypothetical protein
MKKKNPVHKQLSNEEQKDVLKDLDSDGTLVEVAEAMIALDPSKATKEAADKMLKEADEKADEKADQSS